MEVLLANGQTKVRRSYGRAPVGPAPKNKTPPPVPEAAAARLVLRCANLPSRRSATSKECFAVTLMEWKSRENRDFPLEEQQSLDSLQVADEKGQWVLCGPAQILLFNKNGEENASVQRQNSPMHSYSSEAELNLSSPAPQPHETRSSSPSSESSFAKKQLRVLQHRRLRVDLYFLSQGILASSTNGLLRENQRVGVLKDFSIHEIWKCPKKVLRAMLTPADGFAKQVGQQEVWQNIEFEIMGVKSSLSQGAGTPKATLNVIRERGER